MKQEDKMSKTKLMPFDIEKAKNGAKVVTRCGMPVRLLSYDVKGKTPIVAAINCGRCEDVFSFYENGKPFSGSKPDDFDLFIEEEVEARFMTLEELSLWLSEKPHRQCMITTTAFITSNIGYNISHKDDKAEAYLIREDGGEWMEPVITK